MASRKQRFDDIRDLLSAWTGVVRAQILRIRLAHVGRSCRIDRGVVIRNASRVWLGDHVWLKEGVIIDGRRNHDLSIRLDTGVTIRAYTYIDAYDGSVTIGPGSQVAQHGYIGGNGGVKIGVNVMIAANVCISSVAHGFTPSDMPFIAQTERRSPVTIEDNVWIAANATIIDGVTVGTGSVVAAGAVVTRDVPTGVLVGGIPASVIRSIRDLGWRLSGTSPGSTQPSR